MCKFKKLTIENIQEKVDYFLKYIDVKKVVFSIFDELNDFVFGNGDISDEKFEIAMSYIGSGKQIGNGLDNRINAHLNKITKFLWRHGKDVSEVDCIAENFLPDKDHIYSIRFEYKTTGVEKYHIDGVTISPQRPVWSKTSAGGNENGTKYTNESINEYEFCVFCGYHIPKNKNEKFKINSIYVGIYRPSDLSISKNSTGNGARISADKFNNQFIQIF